MDPVVIALILGIVTVGEVACAVKGIAEPSLMSLSRVSFRGGAGCRVVHNSRLGVLESRIGRVDEVTVYLSAIAQQASFLAAVLTFAMHLQP